MNQLRTVEPNILLRDRFDLKFEFKLDLELDFDLKLMFLKLYWAFKNIYTL